MPELIYDNDGLQIRQHGSKFYLRYDAGAHWVAIREDEISKDEATQVMTGSAEATNVLFGLQKRLTLSGINPHVSNLPSDK
jgi:hypothetical protein